MIIRIDEHIENADWIKTLHWDLPTTVEELIELFGRDRLPGLLTVPAAQAMPPELRTQIIAEIERSTTKAEAKVGHVRDPEYWGAPYGTPITPGMRPAAQPPIPGIPPVPPVPLSDEARVRRAGQFHVVDEIRAEARYLTTLVDSLGEISFEDYDNTIEYLDNTYGLQTESADQGDPLLTGDWSFFGGCREMREAAYDLLGYEQDDMTTADPNLFSGTTDRSWGISTPQNPEVKAWALLDRLKTADRSEFPLYRGMNVDDLQKDRLLEDLTPGTEFDLPIASFTGSQHVAGSFAGGDWRTPRERVVFKVRRGARAIRGAQMGAPPSLENSLTERGEELDWDEAFESDTLSEYATGGRFRVTHVAHHGGVTTISIRQIGVFDPDTALVVKASQANRRWKYAYLFDDAVTAKAPPSKEVEKRMVVARLEHLLTAFQDLEAKLVRRVRDPAYWGLPYGTPITPGMKPRPEPDLRTLPAKEYSVPRVVAELKKIKPTGLPAATGMYSDPIDCGDDIEKAHRLLADHKSIRLNTPLEVSMLIDIIEREAEEAQKEGREPHLYNLCQITIPGTNLFCHDSKGISRAEMPQLKGLPLPGSYAEYTGGGAKVDVTPEFLGLLASLGIETHDDTLPVTKLKATQNELSGATVARLRERIHQTGQASSGDPAIFVTRDGYVVDGHHRWAAEMTRDLEDNHLGDVEMPVHVIDADIGYILDLTRGFSQMIGIQQQRMGERTPSGVASPDAPDMPKPKVIEVNGEPLTQGKDSLWDHLVPDGKGGWRLSKERQMLHNQIVHRIIDGHPAQADPVFVLIGGGVGSGKTSLQGIPEGVPKSVPDMPPLDEAVRIDLDDVKNMIHELAPVEGMSADARCGFLHEESSYLGEEARIVAQARQTHIILDGTGNSNVKKLSGKIERAQRAGYRVDGVYGTIPTQLAWARNLLRAHMPGTVRGEVSPQATTGSHQKVSQVVKDGATDVFDTFRLYDTSSRPPYTLVAEATKGGEIIVHEPDVWRGFLSKPGSWTPEELEAIRSEVTPEFLDQKGDLPAKFYDYGWRHPD